MSSVMSPLEVPVWITGLVNEVPLIEPASVATSRAPAIESSVTLPLVVRTFTSDVREPSETLPPLVCTSTLPPTPAISTSPPPPTTFTATSGGTETRYSTSQMNDGPMQSALTISVPPSTVTSMSGLTSVHFARRLTCTSLPSAGTTTTSPAELSIRTWEGEPEKVTTSF